MGIRIGANTEDVSTGAFSQDILKIEINGPDVSLYVPDYSTIGLIISSSKII